MLLVLHVLQVAIIMLVMGASNGVSDKPVRNGMAHSRFTLLTCTIGGI